MTESILKALRDGLRIYVAMFHEIAGSTPEIHDLRLPDQPIQGVARHDGSSDFCYQQALVTTWKSEHHSIQGTLRITLDVHLLAPNEDGEVEGWAILCWAQDTASMPLPGFYCRLGWSYELQPGLSSVLPAYPVAHRIEHHTSGAASVGWLPDSMIGDQQWRAVALLLNRSQEALAVRSFALLNSQWIMPQRTASAGALSTMVRRAEQRRWRLLSEPQDPNFGYREYPGGAGGDKTQGPDPLPAVRHGALDAIDQLQCEMLGWWGRRPQHIQLSEFVRAVDIESGGRAPFFFTGLHRVSRNRLGRPEMNAAPRLREVFNRGLTSNGNARALDPQHWNTPIFLLARVTRSPFWRRQAREAAYVLLHSLHDPTVSIRDGGYNSALFPHHRGWARTINALWQARAVASDEAWDADLAELVTDYIQDVVRWTYEIWYERSVNQRTGPWGNWEDVGRPDGHVLGREAIAVWQVPEMIIMLALIARDLGMPDATRIKARAMGVDLARVLVESWELRGETWGAYKLLAANDRALGRDWHPRHDGQTLNQRCGIHAAISLQPDKVLKARLKDTLEILEGIWGGATWGQWDSVWWPLELHQEKDDA